MRDPQQKEMLVCMCPCMHMHKCVQACIQAVLFLCVCVCTHIKQSVPVCADQCVGFFCLPVSVYRHNKPNRAQRASFSIHCGQRSMGPQRCTRICKTVLPPMQVFLHSIAVKYTRYVVPCLSHDRVKEMCRYEDVM